MTPKLIEVSADLKDFAEDSLKAAVVLASGWLLNKYVYGSDSSFDATQSQIMALMIGLGVFHFVVDSMLVRFVVKDGQEGYYTARRRYK